MSEVGLKSEVGSGWVGLVEFNVPLDT